jgi:hypothetical protein
MTGDWAYDELVPIAGVEFTILSLAVALSAVRRGHGLFHYVPISTKRTVSATKGCVAPDEDTHSVCLICDVGSAWQPVSCTRRRKPNWIWTSVDGVALADGRCHSGFRGLSYHLWGVALRRSPGQYLFHHLKLPFVTFPSRRPMGSTAC